MYGGPMSLLSNGLGWATSGAIGQQCAAKGGVPLFYAKMLEAMMLAWHKRAACLSWDRRTLVCMSASRLAAGGKGNMFFSRRKCHSGLFFSHVVLCAGFHNRWLPQRQQEQLHNRSPENPSCLAGFAH